MGRDELEALRKAGRLDELKRQLLGRGRRALGDRELSAGELHDAAELLQEYEEFGFARRLMRRARTRGDQAADRKRQRREALFTYKDLELPAGPRLDRALDILKAGAPLADSGAEWLGLAGGILKRRWLLRGSAQDLEQALRSYLHGWEKEEDPERCYPGINAAFLLDQLSALRREDAVVPIPEPDPLRRQADEIRSAIVPLMEARVASPKPQPWHLATLAEAQFGLEDFEAAERTLARYAEAEDVRDWWLESTATQLMALAQLRGFGEAARRALTVLLPERAIDPSQLATGKIGLALSGGGFRASLFHVGVLARMAELDVLRRVEVLSCVSGGSIVGAFYYLKLRELLERERDEAIKQECYVRLVAELAEQLLDSVQQNLRVRMFAGVRGNARMLRSREFSRTDQMGRLLQERLFAKVSRPGSHDRSPWRMRELAVLPADSPQGFSPAWGNWRRGNKVPVLVINAATVNTGHAWQFTASWMGEPPATAREEIDANPRLRRVYYRDAPAPHGDVTLATAVAASACVPMLFPPVTLEGLYQDITVQLLDGGMHDNQGIASLLEQDCATIVVSDASGQMNYLVDPRVKLTSIARRMNLMLAARVRAAQFADLDGRLRSKALRGLVVVHMRKGLEVEPRDWLRSQDPYLAADDVLRGERPSYGIDPDVQRALSELRTDLDTFLDDEALPLMAAGYKMACVELASLPGPDRSDVPSREWIFTPALDQIARPASESGLAVPLTVGRSLFLKPFRWRKAARRGTFPLTPPKPRRKPSRALAPVRFGLSFPLGAAGALATRIYLRTVDQRFTRRHRTRD